ncbi:MAG: Phosphoglycerate mutase-like protein [Betaproteobacteria bacterium]|nr:Phosphoglycerate mutase-like protein [Betaproteobacteria bacterium]
MSAWPKLLWAVRHGQSAGNVARDAAEAGRLAKIDIATRDMDVPLSPLGEDQASALGEWFGGLEPDERPDVILCSPYLRARQTAQLVSKAAQWKKPKIRVDERLREKEFGILDRLTHLGITQQYPGLSEQRGHIGKFYFRPPGGESWCDVILRLRSVLEMITREYAEKNVLIVAHQVTANCLKYLIEQMDEAKILEIDSKGDIPNCAVTSYRAHTNESQDQVMKLELVNFVAPVKNSGTPVTAEPDVPSAPGA